MVTKTLITITTASTMKKGEHFCCCLCKINSGICDEQHKCKECKRFLHAICGHYYFDENNEVVEDLAFPKICNQCYLEKIEKDKSKGDKSPNATDTDESDKDNENSNDDQNDNDNEDDSSEDNFTPMNKLQRTVFTMKELNDHNPGFYMIEDLSRNENILDRFTCPSDLSSKTRLKGKLVTIPAMYWGEEDIKTGWWRGRKYHKDIQKLSDDEIKRTVLFGKVTGFQSSCYIVELMVNALDDEANMVKADVIRNYLYVEKKRSANSKKKKNAASSKKAGRKKDSEKNMEEEEDNEEEDEDNLIEDDEYESEDDLQYEDGSETLLDDVTNTNDSGTDDEVSDFNRVEPRTKIMRKWKVIEDKKSTNYSRPNQFG